MSTVSQARKPLTGEQRVRLNGYAATYVGVQNIALARIDTVKYGSDGTRRVALNLYGLPDIDRLIEALQVARARLVAEGAALDAYLAAHPEAILPPAGVTKSESPPKTIDTELAQA